MTLLFIELRLLFLLGGVDGPIAPWDPKRRAEETGQTGGHPPVASWFFLFHVVTGKKEALTPWS